MCNTWIISILYEQENKFYIVLFMHKFKRTKKKFRTFNNIENFTAKISVKLKISNIVQIWKIVC